MASFRFLLMVVAGLGFHGIAGAQIEGHGEGVMGDSRHPVVFEEVQTNSKSLPKGFIDISGGPEKPIADLNAALPNREQHQCIESKIGRPQAGSRPPSLEQMKTAMQECGVQEPSRGISSTERTLETPVAPNDVSSDSDGMH